MDSILSEKVRLVRSFASRLRLSICDLRLSFARLLLSSITLAITFFFASPDRRWFHVNERVMQICSCIIIKSCWCIIFILNFFFFSCDAILMTWWRWRSFEPGWRNDANWFLSSNRSWCANDETKITMTWKVSPTMEPSENRLRSCLSQTSNIEAWLSEVCFPWKPTQLCR